MRAIILCAGQGKRLRPLTNSIPKCLVELAGKTILEHQVEVLKSCGFDENEISIVGGFNCQKLERFNIKVFTNKDYMETNMVHSLMTASEWFTDDILIAYGDIIFNQSTLETFLESKGKNKILVDLQWKKLWDKRMSNPLDDAETLKFDDKKNICEIGKRAKNYSEIMAQYTGLLFFSKDLAMELLSEFKGMDPKRIYDDNSFSNLYMTSFISYLIDRNWTFKAITTNRGWVELDTIEDFKLYQEIISMGGFSKIFE